MIYVNIVIVFGIEISMFVVLKNVSVSGVMLVVNMWWIYILKLISIVVMVDIVMVLYVMSGCW